MVTEIYISDFTNNHLPVPYWFPVIVLSFFWLDTHKCTKRKRLSCTIWTPIVKNIGKTYSIKVQGDFYLHCWRRVIRHFRVFRTEKSLGVILRIFSSIQIFIFYFILLKVFLRSSCQQCNVVTHLLVLHFGWHQR